MLVCKLCKVSLIEDIDALKKKVPQRLLVLVNDFVTTLVRHSSFVVTVYDLLYHMCIIIYKYVFVCDMISDTVECQANLQFLPSLTKTCRVNDHGKSLNTCIQTPDEIAA